MVSGILEADKKIESGEGTVSADTNTLALDSETPLPIRSSIILQSYALSKCVSYSRESKGDTLCLPQRTPIRIGCCNRAAGYPRVSDESLYDSKTLESQEKEIRRYIEKQGYELNEDHMYPEAMTAYMKPFRERPQFMNMLDAARRKEFDVLVVTEYSRLSRRQIEQAVIIHMLEQYGVKVESITEKYEDSPVGNLLRSVYAFEAESERAKIHYRTTRGRLDRVKNGNLTGHGRPAYGYVYIDTKDETSSRYILSTKVIYKDSDGIEWTEPKVIIFVFELADKGVAVRQIAVTLTKMGIPTPRSGIPYFKKVDGKRVQVTPKPYWMHNTVYRILTNPMYIGIAVAFKHKRENGKLQKRDECEQIPLPDGVVPPILISPDAKPDTELFERVQKALDANKTDATRNNHHSDEELGLLRSGYAKCGICGHNMRMRYYSASDVKQSVAYACILITGHKDHKHVVQIVAHHLDAEAWNIAVKHIKDPALVKAKVEALRKKIKEEGTDNRASIEETIKDIKRKINNLWKLAQEATDDDSITSLQMVLNGLERQKREAEAMLLDLDEEEELKEKIAAEIERFEKWADKVRPSLTDPNYHPTYEEKRLAIRILGITATVYPVKGDHKDDYKDRVSIDVRPPDIVTLISCYS
jgi:site-specific DNA recombinase